MKKFTYKKLKKTGPYRSFQRDYTDVKLGGKNVGAIRELKDSTYEMGLIVEDPNGKNCEWKWVFLTVRGKDSEQSCRTFLNERCADIQGRFKLYPLED